MTKIIDLAKRFKQQHDDKPVREGGLFPNSQRLVEALESLRDRVDNYNQFPKLILNEEYVSKQLTPSDFRWIQVDGFKFGYAMEFVNLVGSDYMMRRVVVTVQGWDINDLSEAERKDLLGSLCEVFFIKGGDPPDVMDLDISTMMFYQFIPIMFRHEKNPGIVTPSQGYFKSLRFKKPDNKP